MIEMTYLQLQNTDFGKALRKIVESEEIKKVDTILKISRIYKAIGKADGERVEAHQKLLRAYGVQDPDSKVHRLYIPASKQDEWDIEYKKLTSQTFKIEEEPLKTSEISSVKLTAADIAGLDGILAP